MMRKWLLPVLALAGLVIALVMVRRHQAPPQAAPLATLTAQAPYPHYIFGTGLIEASTGNIAIGTPVAGIVADVFVKWGDPVKPGEPLFKIDDRDLQSELPAAAARAHEAGVAVAQAKYLLQNAERLRAQGIISEQDFNQRRFQTQGAGAALASSQAEIQRIRMEIARRTVNSPAAGRVLQINIRAGESTESGAAGKALMVIGDDRRLYVRIDVDESDIWRFHPEAAARASVRGNPGLSVPLQFERVEPLVIAKTALTGGAAERTDTRVLQVLYGFDRENRPVQIGQQMDVYIEAPPVEQKSGSPPTPPKAP
jgi:RND family efflux transporter MFP subunit